MDQYVAARPGSSALYAKARNLLAGRFGHDLRRSDPIPLYIGEGSGSRIRDVDGNEYVDYRMGNGALMLGHAYPEVIAAIREAATRGTHFGNDHPLQLEWAELLTGHLDSAELVRFVNSGTEATFLAHRIAQAHTRRPKLLKFEGHFHGWHDHALVGMAPPFDVIPSAGVPERTVDETVVIPEDADRLAAVLAADEQIAAIILEPSGASWGRVPIARHFVQEVRRLASQHGVVLIFDEVITGFRWSLGGAQGALGVTPDLTCLAKITAGGMPGGAVVGKAEIMSQLDFDTSPKVIHYGTFNASPLTAAAAVATIRALAAIDATAHADRVAAQIRGEMEAIVAAHGLAAFVYGESSTFHVYFETDLERITRVGSDGIRTFEPARLKGMPAQLVMRYQQLMRSHGVEILSSTGGITSAVHDDPDVDWLLTAFEKTLVTLRDEGLIATVE